MPIQEQLFSEGMSDFNDTVTASAFDDKKLFEKAYGRRERYESTLTAKGFKKYMKGWDRAEFLNEEHRLDMKRKNELAQQNALEDRRYIRQSSADLRNECTRQIRSFLALTSAAIIGFILLGDYDLPDIIKAICLILLALTNIASFLVLFVWREIQCLKEADKRKKLWYILAGKYLTAISIVCFTLAVIILLAVFLIGVYENGR